MSLVDLIYLVTLFIIRVVKATNWMVQKVGSALKMDFGQEKGQFVEVLYYIYIAFFPSLSRDKFINFLVIKQKCKELLSRHKILFGHRGLCYVGFRIPKIWQILKRFA